MCPMEEGKLITCELAFYPLDSKDSRRDIALVLDIIEEAGVDYEIGPMSSYVKGSPEKVFKLLEAIHLVSSERAIEYSMALLMSNTCGI